MKSYGIHWFRRDLRLAGNLALQKNWQENHGRVVGLFCFDRRFLARPDFSSNRFAFFLETLQELKKEMKRNGGDLLVVDDQPTDFFSTLDKKFKILPSLVTFNRDYEPFARERDALVIKQLEAQGLGVATFRDHLLFEPTEVLKDNGEYYQVYGPFSKKWYEKFTGEGKSRVASESEKSKLNFSLSWHEVLKKDIPDSLAEFIKINSPRVDISLPKAGPHAALQALEEFAHKIKEYKVERDIPSLKGTAQISFYLKNGSLTVAQVINFLKLTRANFFSPDGPGQFLKELIWREFYYSILWHRPDVETGPFIRSYKNIKWSCNENWFKCWCEGKTGFPIVDAGMRQLNQTGWMHNRVRMIVASFLTKDLLIDWRWGEKYFMEKLIDGDLAPNNGGWQWAASTGCDPQPYFRVFNPFLQSKKFDPEGEYIKTYVPELAKVEGRKLHEPLDIKEYGPPIVDHGAQRIKAIALFREAK